MYSIFINFHNSLITRERLWGALLIILAVMLPCFYLKDLGESTVTILLTVISIFGGLLFNLLVLFWSEAAKYKEREMKLEEERAKTNSQHSRYAAPLQLLEGLREGINVIFHHISFTLLIAILAIVSLLTTLIFPNSYQNEPSWWKNVDLGLTIIAYGLISLFFYSVFLTLKKVHTIYMNKIALGI